MAPVQYDHAVKTLLLVLAFSAFAVAESASEAEVRAAHDAMVKAAQAGDATALDKLLAPGLQYSHSSAKLENKEEAIAAMVKSKANYEIHAQTIHVYGNAATLRAKLTSHGATGDIPLTMLMVWVKNGGQWQLVERHTTRIPVQ